MKVLLKEKHPLVIRWNHWINFPLLLIMIWSGAMIYWAHSAYGVPGEWLETLGLSSRLAEGLSWHFAFSIVFMLNGLVYVTYLIFSGQWRDIFPKFDSIKEAVQVTLHDLKLSKNPLPKFKKYNGAQKFAYTGVLFLGIGATLTGLAIYKPVQLNALVELLGGYQTARQEHFMITLLFMIFFLIHVAQVIRAGWQNLFSMITGWEKQDEK